MRPKSITTFQILAWISVGLSALGLLFALVVGGLVAGSVGPRGFGGLFALAMVIPIAIVGGLGLFTYLAANKRSNVGRWLYVALAGLLVLFNLLGIFAGNSNAVGVIIVLLMTALLVASIVFLLTPESNAWFAGTYQGHGGGYPPQHGNYPPQHGGYPPQHGGGYPPQPGQVGGGGYAPQQGGYSPQGGGYPPQQGQPQQGGYPPQQGGGYPPQQGGGYPPQPSGGYPPSSGGGYPPQ